MSGANDDNDLRIPFPLELVIGRTPLSAQAAKPAAKEDWKATVGRCAKDKISEARELYFLDDRPLMATIYYFPPSKMQGDVDNIVKPILDAMNHVVYPGDKHIEKAVVQKFEPGLPWLFSSPSSSLEAAIKMDKPVLYVRLEDDLSWRQVL